MLLTHVSEKGKHYISHTFDLVKAQAKDEPKGQSSHIVWVGAIKAAPQMPAFYCMHAPEESLHAIKAP